MGRNEKCSWDDGKQALNITRHGFDFADALEIFDGRFLLTRLDDRFAYGEPRFNTLAEFHGRIVNVTFTPRAGKVHLISIRQANRKERKVYNAKRQNKS